MLRRVITFMGFCGLLFAILAVKQGLAQVPSGVLRKKTESGKKQTPESAEVALQPLMYFDPDDPSKFPELVHRMPYKFRSRHLPIIIGNSPSPSSVPESPINWR
jgi:hypothetical protein